MIKNPTMAHRLIFLKDPQKLDKVLSIIYD